MVMRRLQHITLTCLVRLASACHPDELRATGSVPSATGPSPGDTTRTTQAVPAVFSPALHEAIRQEVAHLNAVRAWSGMRKKRLFDSTEGGEAIFYTLGVVKQIGQNLRLRDAVALFASLTHCYAIKYLA